MLFMQDALLLARLTLTMCAGAATHRIMLPRIERLAKRYAEMASEDLTMLVMTGMFNREMAAQTTVLLRLVSIVLILVLIRCQFAPFLLPIESAGTVDSSPLKNVMTTSTRVELLLGLMGMDARQHALLKPALSARMEILLDHQNAGRSAGMVLTLVFGNAMTATQLLGTDAMKTAESSTVMSVTVEVQLFMTHAQSGAEMEEILEYTNVMTQISILATAALQPAKSRPDGHAMAEIGFNMTSVLRSAETGLTLNFMSVMTAIMKMGMGAMMSVWLRLAGIALMGQVLAQIHAGTLLQRSITTL